MGRRRRRRVTKSLPASLQAGTGGRVTDLAGIVHALQQPVTGEQAPMPRDTFPYSFGPGVPLQSAPLDPVRRDTGRAEPRQWEYPVTWNVHVPGQDNRLVPWKVLRDAADRIAIIRDCLRVRKNEIIALDWDIVVSQRAVEVAQREDPDAKRIDIERQLRQRLGPEIDRCVRFWEQPDPRNGHDFATWISKVLEEHLVLDALAIYPRYTLGGQLYGLEVIDGTTIKPLLDHTGGRPLPPQPAYQQILHGFPRGEYHADTDVDADGNPIAGYPADRLIYRVKEARTFTPYGFSAVEQSLEDADLWLKRMAWLKAEYTDGVMPAGWLKNTGATSWTPEQVLTYEQELNDYYSGLTRQRMRYRVLPPGLEPVESRGVDERYKPDYDLHLLKLVCAHFDMTIAELGFTESKGLGSSGYHEGQENVQERKGTRPTLKWLAGVLTDISRKHLGMPEELEFRWLGLDDEDQAAAVELDIKRFQVGGKTLNELRDAAGAPRYAFAEADMPMIVTQRGVVFLEGASEASPGVLVGPAESPPAPAPGAAAEPDAGSQAGEKPQDGPGKPAGGEEARRELAAYRRWATKRRSRPFVFEYLTRDQAAAAGVDLDRVVFKASDAGPKAPARQAWPGWEVDLAAATVWAGRLRTAMTGAVPTRALAERWLAARKAATAAGTADARGWLGSQGVDITAALGQLLEGVWTEGYAIGNRSAVSLLGGVDPNWGGWTPGDPEAARRLLDDDHGLRALLDQAGVQVRSIAANRLDALAEVLAEALEAGEAPDTLAARLVNVLDDPRWADMVAVTELSRASSAATRDSYRRNGVEAAYWMTAADERVCDLCADNEDAGAVPLDQPFPTGVYQPPAHPLCRCALAPVIASPSEVEST